MKVNDRGYMWPHLLLWNQFARLLRFNEDDDELVFARGVDGTIELSSRRKQTNYGHPPDVRAPGAPKSSWTFGQLITSPSPGLKSDT